MTASGPLFSRAAAGPQEKGGRTAAQPPEIKHMTPSTVTPIGQASPLGFIKEGAVSFTPAQAGLILRECAYEGQRAIDPTHVLTLRELMRRKLWAAKDKIDFARVGGRLILINGYHRMTAQLDSGRDVEWMVAIHDCATLDDARGLYHRFDTNIRTRSENNILQGVSFAERFGLTKSVATALYKASGVISTGFRMAQQSSVTAEDKVARRIVDDRLAICEAYAPAAATFWSCIEAAPAEIRGRMLIGGFFAVAIATMRHAPAQAQDFWGGLARNDGLRRYDPRSVLLQDLMVRNRKVGPMMATVVQPAKAWNAYVGGHELRLIRIRTGERIPIRHTPFTVVA